MDISKRFIYVEGIIGAGKSTFIQNIQSKLKEVRCVQEPVDDWIRSGILQDYYDDMSRWGFSFQLRIIHDKVTNLNALKHNYELDSNPVSIVERSIYSDECFSRALYRTGILQESEYKLSCDVRGVYSKLLDVIPSLIIYIRPPLDTCMERVKKRNRKEESDLTVEYQSELLCVHDELFYNKTFHDKFNNIDIPVLILEDNALTEDVLYAIQTLL